jgi:septum formation protein
LSDLVLASGSVTRRALLERAGLVIEVDPSGVDEGLLKRQARAGGLDAAGAAKALALAKASAVAARHPGRLVLGCDQMLECDGVWFDKPAGPQGAALQIASLAGRTHSLFSAATVLRNGRAVWATVDSAQLTMRPLSEAFVARYVDRMGALVEDSVGGYQIEGLGIQLFGAISGDHFTILGLPLLPLLAFLRAEGVIRS